jgi:hemoglobin
MPADQVQDDVMTSIDESDAPARPTVYDAIGGSAAVTVAVDILHDRLLADPVVAHHFTDVDIRRLSAHMRAFLTAVLGGPELYQGRDMGAAHARLGITGEQWDVTVGHVVGTLESLDVPADLIGEPGARLTPLRDAIVTA